MCGGELIYSEGTHDLCCVKNPYESAAAREEGGVLHEERAEYGGAKDAHIYKVWGEERESKNFINHYIKDPHPNLPPASGEGIKNMPGDKLACGSIAEKETVETPAQVQGHTEESAVYVDTGEASAEGADSALVSATPIKRHGCVFAVSFTESARFGTLWSVRVVHGETNYFALMRLMQKIEKRRAAGEPLAANAPHLPKKRERSPAAKLAFRFGIEEEDVYSIKFSSETVKRLAVFYGIPERDVKRIREEELGEE
jgi:hypothetical protein